MGFLAINKIVYQCVCYSFLSQTSNFVIGLQVWIEGASQALYTFGICYAALTAFGSYNKSDYNFLRQGFEKILIYTKRRFACVGTLINMLLLPRET